MYVRFKILTVKPILGEKSILIESTHEIDQQTITPENIRITKPGDPVEELLWDTFEAKGKQITLYLKDYPKTNERYIVRISDLKNIIDDSLETNYNQSIEFVSFTRSEIIFDKPIMHSKISSLEISIIEKVFDNQRMGANYFEYELSSDPLFLSDELLIEKQQSSEKDVVFDLLYQGQIFIRCRACYIEHHTTHYSNWINTTCTISTQSDFSESDFEPMLQLELEVLETPANNLIEQAFTYVFHTEQVTNLESIAIVAKPIDGKSAMVINSGYEFVLNNMLVITPEAPLPKNCLINVSIKNIKSGARTIKNYTHRFYSILEPCFGDLKDIEALIDIDIALDPELVYYHLIEASKLAEYYAKIKLNNKQKNMLYYDKVENAEETEKRMFVIYYAANQILSQIRSKLAFNASLSGKLGEIEYTPKGAMPDLTSVLRNLMDEADKWKLALQGYKDHPPDSTSVIKAKKYLPYVRR